MSITEVGRGRSEFFEKPMMLELQGPSLAWASSSEGLAEVDDNVFSFFKNLKKKLL